MNPNSPRLIRNWMKKKGRDRYQELIDSELTAVYTCDATG